MSGCVVSVSTPHFASPHRPPVGLTFVCLCPEDNPTAKSLPAFNTTSYSILGPKPKLFKVGGDRIEVEVKGCLVFKIFNVFCCFNGIMPNKPRGPGICTQFDSAYCCFMLPGKDQHPRLPGDLVPLLPTLTQTGQCEQRRRGRRVLNCCRGSEPQDPNPKGKAALICSTVGELRCCYYPFAGISMARKIVGSTSKGGVALLLTVKDKVEE